MARTAKIGFVGIQQSTDAWKQRQEQYSCKIERKKLKEVSGTVWVSFERYFDREHTLKERNERIKIIVW